MPIRALLISLLLASTPFTVMAQDSRVRTGSADSQIEIAEGYTVDIFARRLGIISDMVRHPDGTLYVADREGGRIFRVEDRRMDGRSDTTRALPQRFDAPTGLAMIGETLFVADRGGLWQIDSTGSTPILIAPFARSGSTGDPHPLAALPNGSLRLGQSLPDGTTRLLDINPKTGTATLVEAGPGSVIAFSRATPDEKSPLPPWPIVKREDGIWFGANLASARKLKMAARHIWIDQDSNSLVIAAEDGISRAPALLGGIGAVDLTYMGGFDTRAGRIGGGYPGPIVQDDRGLFVSDLDTGRIWRIHEAEDTIVLDTPSSEPEAASRRKTPEELILRGSGMGQASTIDAAPTPINPRGANPPPPPDQPDE